MDTKIYLIILMMASSILFTACPKECISTTHAFECKVKYMPSDSLIKIGDTLWINSSFSCQGLLNTVIQKQEDYCGAIINSTFGVVTLKGDLNPAIDSFDFVNRKGQIITDPSINPNKIKQLYFANDNNQYELMVGIIAKKRGRYYCSVSEAIATRKNSGCEKATFNISIENTIKNLQMVTNFVGRDITEYERSHGYCFEVK
jgi:hypothetical protein